jgi:hypothetical protein
MRISGFGRIASRAVIALFVILFICGAARAEFVFLKDGSIIQGTITNDGKTSIVLREKAGKSKEIQRVDILRILYTELRMSKIYVQKRDGEGLIAYLVDEDRTSYTFRLDLNSPKEFTLDRNDVLFMAEKNPSGLRGEADIDKISLKWLPPYDQVKEYRVYIKRKKEDKYQLTGTSTSKELVLKDLDSNTQYFLIVTSVDTGDYESTPSNEIKLVTKNRPPYRIKSASMFELPSKEIMVKCDETTDSDGKITAYRLYRVYNGEQEKIAEIKTPPFTLKELGKYDKLYVCAVDDLGAESEPRGVGYDIDVKNAVEIAPTVIVPFGKFSKMVNVGFGGMLRYKNSGLLSQDITLGIEAGYVLLHGKSFSANEDFAKVGMIPIMAGLSYDWKLKENLVVSPEIYAGTVIFLPEYHANDTEKGNTYNVLSKRRVIDFGMRAGLGAVYSFSDTWYMNGGAYFGYVRESDGSLMYAQGSLGLGFRF